ncbi:hypothetical protein ACJX0J_039231, partial [Zea mays]
NMPIRIDLCIYYYYVLKNSGGTFHNEKDMLLYDHTGLALAAWFSDLVAAHPLMINQGFFIPF